MYIFIRQTAFVRWSAARISNQLQKYTRVKRLLTSSIFCDRICMSQRCIYTESIVTKVVNGANFSVHHYRNIMRKHKKCSTMTVFILRCTRLKIGAEHFELNELAIESFVSPVKIQRLLCIFSECIFVFSRVISMFFCVCPKNKYTESSC